MCLYNIQSYQALSGQVWWLFCLSCHKIMTSPPTVLLLCPKQIRFLPCVSAHLHLYKQLFVVVAGSESVLHLQRCRVGLCSLTAAPSAVLQVAQQCHGVLVSNGLLDYIQNKGIKGPWKWLISFIRSQAKAAGNTFISLRFLGGWMKMACAYTMAQGWAFPSFFHYFTWGKCGNAGLEQELTAHSFSLH